LLFSILLAVFIITVNSMVKWYSSSWETHLRATERPLPHGITPAIIPAIRHRQTRPAIILARRTRFT